MAEPTTTGPEAAPTDPPAGGVPRQVVITAIALALGLGVLIGARLRRVEVREVPGPPVQVPVAVPCQGCADQAAQKDPGGPADVVAVPAVPVPSSSGTDGTPAES